MRPVPQQGGSSAARTRRCQQGKRRHEREQHAERQCQGGRQQRARLSANRRHACCTRPAGQRLGHHRRGEGVTAQGRMQLLAGAAQATPQGAPRPTEHHPPHVRPTCSRQEQRQRVRRRRGTQLCRPPKRCVTTRQKRPLSTAAWPPASSTCECRRSQRSSPGRGAWPEGRRGGECNTGAGCQEVAGTPTGNPTEHPRGPDAPDAAHSPWRAKLPCFSRRRTAPGEGRG